VIAKGEKILDVVPEEESLGIEAQVPAHEISEVHPNMRRRRAPDRLQGTHHASADRLIDDRTGDTYLHGACAR
jgi:membrane fusion protein, epimerase transport system